MLELKIKQGRKHVPIFDLPAYLGRHEARKEIGDTVEGLIAFLDELGGDPDLEDGGDDEPDGTAQGDIGWTEWHTRGRFKDSPGVVDSAGNQLHEDAEDSDPAEDDDEDCCRAGEDDAAVFSQGHKMGFGWCKSANDPDCEPSGDEQDTGDAEDEHLSCARWLADERCWTALDRGIWGAGSDTRPGIVDRQLEVNDN